MVLVTGAGGMVGEHLLDVFAPEDVTRTGLRPRPGTVSLDVRDRAQVRDAIERSGATQVLHLAAETDVDLCERDVDHAFRSNTLGTLNIALACQALDIELVYVSTAGVFDGTKPEPYTEFDPPGPLSAYARSKYEGEKLVQSLVRRHYVIRAGWMFGGISKDKKFVAKIAEMCLTAGSGPLEIRAVHDKIGSPTFARDFLAAVKLLMGSGVYGLYHVVNTGQASRYEIACEIVRALGTDGVTVQPVPSAMFPLSAPRPRSEAARSYKMDLLGMNAMRPWQEALREYLELIQADSQSVARFA